VSDPTARWRRLAWLALTVAIMGLFAAGLPEYYHQLRTLCAAPACAVSPTAEQVRILNAAGISLAAAAGCVLGVTVFCAAVNAVLAGLLFWRRPTERMATFTALTLLSFGAFGIHDAARVDAVVSAFHPAWQFPVYALMLAGSLGITLLFFVFPDGRFVPRGLRWPAAVWLAWQSLASFFPGSPADPDRWPPGGTLAYWAVFLGTCLFAQIYRYGRVSDLAQRQQTKWAVFGFGLAVALALAAYVLTGLGPAFGPRWAVLALAQSYSYYPFLPLMPVFVGVAVLRSHLWDVDVVIRRTLVYAVLTGLLGTAYLGSVLVLESVFRALTGQAQNSLVVVLSTLAIAALFGPLRGRVQRAIDRRFYRQKYDAARTLAGFAAGARDETDLARISERLVGVVEETMQPASVGLWLRRPP
jgi:hypothetical protein